jgi:NADH dehydrogenase
MKKKVVIVGSGFAGINLAKKLDTKLFDIVLIDKNNYHQFQPLLYQVATAQIEPSTISFPIRYIFRNRKAVKIRMGQANSIDTQNKKLITNIGEFDYDYLVLAMGGKTNYFGNEQISKNSYSLKTTKEALRMRNHILEVFETIVNQTEEQNKAYYNIVIVGAGPTGVELSGAFADIKKYILPIDFHRIDFSNLKIHLIDGSPNTLNSMSVKSQRNSYNYLKKLGIEIHTNTIVSSYDGETLITNTGKKIKTKSVIWSAGITANTIDGIPNESYAQTNRLKVNRINELANCKDIFVIGDMALMETPQYPKGHPQLANVAINQAKNLAKNLNNIEKRKTTKEYEYKDYGTMATISRNKSVVDVGSIHLKGFFAWLVWMFLHLMLILSVRNKLIIFINWSWAYITKNTALRIIIR